MKNFKYTGECNTVELEDIITDILECVSVSNTIASTPSLKSEVNIKLLKFEYKEGKYVAEIQYNIELKDDTTRTFKETP